MFYCQDWTGVKISEFIDILNNYLFWYNTKRVKTSLGNMSPGSIGRALVWLHNQSDFLSAPLSLLNINSKEKNTVMENPHFP